jgi:hypothetical protein
MAYQVVGYTVADSNGGVSIASPVAFIVKNIPCISVTDNQVRQRLFNL